MPVATSASFSHAGAVRRHNEDAYLDAPGAATWVVADGMGGYQAGEVASQTICRAVSEQLRGSEPEGPKAMVQAFLRANEQILAYGREKLAGQTLGSTAVALQFSGGRYHLHWLGDSRCYRFRAGALEQLSRDHSQVTEMVEQGLIQPDEAASHPLANVITRALGVEASPQVDYRSGSLQPNDVFLLCSDGINKVLDDEEIAQFVNSAKVEEASLAIMHTALVREASDNITCVLVRVPETGYSSHTRLPEDDATIPVTVNTPNDLGKHR